MTTQKQWADQTVKNVADAVKARRVALGLTAAELSTRTLTGKPLSRAVISDLETGRKRTLDITELLTLAAALELPPVLLLYPDYPHGYVDMLPGQQRSTIEALDWFAGHSGAAGGLIRLVRELRRIEADILHGQVRVQAEGVSRDEVEMHERVLESLRIRASELPIEIEQARAELWGEHA